MCIPYIGIWESYTIEWIILSVVLFNIFIRNVNKGLALGKINLIYYHGPKKTNVAENHVV